MRLPASVSNARARIAVLLMALLPAAPAPGGSLLETMDQEVSSLYEKSKDAIFKVHAECLPLFGGIPFGPIHRVGTGFFIDGEGRFVTAATLVQSAATCWIEWRGQRLNARLVGADPNVNLALLQIDPGTSAAAGKPTPCLPLGNSDELRVGSMVVTVGFPYELPSAPAVGFVTGLDIRCGAHVFPVNHIRAGCKLHPGQGGGPMFNARGEVVGVAVATQPDDQCFAVPSAALKKVCDDILEHGEPQTGWVGLNVTEQRLTGDDEAAGWRVLVQEVSSNSPAAAAGFEDRDVLVRICTNEIRRSADVLNTMFYRRCGDRINMLVLREGRTQQVAVVVGRRPTAELLRPATGPRPGNIPLPAVVPASAERGR